MAASTDLYERPGLSFRMTDKRDRFIYTEFNEGRSVDTNRSSRARELLGLGLAAERALDKHDIELPPPDENEEPITDVEAFIEEAVSREIERMGAGQIRELLG